MEIEGLPRAEPERTALLRIAALIAAGDTAVELFPAVVAEVARTLLATSVGLGRYGADGTVTVLAAANATGEHWSQRIATKIRQTGRSVRDGSMVGVPVTVDGAVWGLLCAVASDREPLPADADDRLRAFAELVTVAIATDETRRRMAERPAALRRVATLVAEGVPAAELLAVVAQEIVRTLDVPTVALLRYEPVRAVTVVASVNAPEFAVGSRWPLDGPSLSTTIQETGRPARIEDYTGLESTLAAGVRESGLRSGAGVPIVVDGGVWGAIFAGCRRSEPLPADIETRLGEFAELVAIAISGAEARERRRRLADQQVALRRVATLAAEGSPPADLLASLAAEVTRTLEVASVTVVRYEPGGTPVVVASVNDAERDAGPTLLATVFETAGPAQDESAAAVPIVVDGAVWGAVAVTRWPRRAALPDFGGSYTGRILLATASAEEVEARLAAFVELAATAISKAQANDELRQLAEEQAALRRVATLVAQANLPEEVFAAVAGEVARILGVPRIEMVRYEDDGTATVVAASGDARFPVGSRWVLDGPSVIAMVRQTGRPCRIDDFDELGGTIAKMTRDAGLRSAIGAPIIAGGRPWGAIIALSPLSEPIPERSAVRLSQFTELVATAVSNATARADLIASRARIVAAADEARRRFERDLHDGTQQRLIALRLDLQRIRATIPEGLRDANAGLEEAERDIEGVLEEVRKVSRGLHPAQLARVGLGRSLQALARKSPIAVDLDVAIGERPPAPLERAIYYVVSEAVTNAIKHSRASAISVAVTRCDTLLRAAVADDGVGGAAVGTGTGLTGLNDRVEALGGRIEIESPRGAGTRIVAELPIPALP